MNELSGIKITSNGDKLTVSSRDVAESFEKEHGSIVVRAIENIINEMGSPQNCTHLFVESKYQHEQNRQWYKEYQMTRDGFSLLAMGFTGSKALRWKLKYIEAFNQMEVEMNSPEKIMARALKIADEKINCLQMENVQQKQIISELNPKASYYDIVLQCKDLLAATLIAKDYGKSAEWLNKKLNELGIQFRQGRQGEYQWILYQKYAQMGYTQSKTHMHPDRNGIMKSRMQTYWTQKGRLFIYDLLKSEGIVPNIERS